MAGIIDFAERLGARRKSGQVPGTAADEAYDQLLLPSEAMLYAEYFWYKLSAGEVPEEERAAVTELCAILTSSLRAGAGQFPFRVRAPLRIADAMSEHGAPNVVMLAYNRKAFMADDEDGENGE